MANIKLLQEAIQAFASGETKSADAKVRKFFIEQAQEINKKFEQEMNESLDSGEQSSFEDEVEFKFKFDDGKGSEGWEATNDPINEADEEHSEVEAGSEEFETKTGGEVEHKSEEDPWDGIRDAFDELESLFAELEGAEHGDEVEAGAEEVETGSEFDDVDFGEESFKESVEAGRMKKVTEPKEKAADSRSPVAGQPEAFVKGVEPIDIKDGSVDIKTTENSTSMSQVDVEDNDNVMDNAKGLMKKVKEPKTTAENSRSPLPKSAGK